MNYTRKKCNVIALAMLAMCFLLLASCSGDEPDVPETPKPDEPVGRTVLVYMLSASNGLGEYAPYDYDIQDLDEMVEAAKRGDIDNGRLIVFHSSSNGNQILKEITPNGIDTLKIYDNSLLPQTVARMTQVFDDMESLTPADDYALVLWGHGSGWLQDGIVDADADRTAQPLSYGGEHYGSGKCKYWMNITSLATALEGRNFHFLYMDCCYMASVEVAYQLRNAVRWIVAYSTEVLGWGMPYDENVKCFFKSEPDLIQSAKNTFAFYDAQQNPRYRMCTVSVLDTRGIDGLAAATRDIYSKNKVGYVDGYEYQPFMVSSISYYHDFGSYVHSLTAGSEQFEAFDEALSDVVVFEDATARIWGTLDINNHSGLSTYIMTGTESPNKFNYNQLDWYKDVASHLAVE